VKCLFIFDCNWIH